MTFLDERPSASEGGTLATGDLATPQALFDEARRRRRNRRWWAVAISVGLTIAVTVAIVVHTESSPGTAPTVVQKHQTTGITSVAIPAEMVVWKDFRIDLISSTTGRLIRTLARDIALYRGTPHPTVSPGGTVYFDNAHAVNITVPSGQILRAPSEQILSVPLSGGPLTVVADGHDPVVSPDGRFLAYATYVDYTNGREAIVERDLLTGLTKTWQYSNTGPDISNLAWSPDSESLSFSAVTPTPDNRSEALGAWALSVSTPSGSLDVARKIPLPPGMAWAGYLNPVEGIGVLQHPGLTRQRAKIEFSVVDVRTGRVITRLPSVPGQLGVGNIFDGAEGTVQIDLSGQHLALVEVGSGNGTLYRWTIGHVPNHISAHPIQVATGVVGAAWVPAR